MRCLWYSVVLIAAFAVTLTGCSNDPFADSGVSGDSSEPAAETTAPVAEADTETSWQLLDDSELRVWIDPPGVSETMLRARRGFDMMECGPLKRLHYRFVTDDTPDAQWIAFPKPDREDDGEGVYWHNYEALVTMPKGTVFVQLKIDHGGGNSYELTDWSVEVK